MIFTSSLFQKMAKLLTTEEGVGSLLDECFRMTILLSVNEKAGDSIVVETGVVCYCSFTVSSFCPKYLSLLLTQNFLLSS